MASSGITGSSSHFGPHNQLEESTTSYEGKATLELRYLHICDDMETRKKFTETGLKTLVLGPGLIATCSATTQGFNYGAPQAYEFGFLMRGPNQSLDIVDNNPDSLDCLREGFNYDLTPAMLFFHKQKAFNADGKLFNDVLMQPCKGKLNGVKNLLNLILASAHGITSRPPIRFISWDPQTPSTLPPEINDTYHVIVATCSALFPDYIPQEKIAQTWMRTLSLLKNRGVLYVDSISFEELMNDPNRLEQLSRTLGSSLTTRKISPIIEMSKANREILAPAKSKALGHSIGHDVSVFRTSPKGLCVSGATTHPVYAIKRKIPLIEELQGLYPKATADEYWHFIAKNTVTKAAFTSEKLSAMIQKLNAYPYTSKHHGLTPLHVAVLSNNPEAVAFFLSDKFPALEQKDHHGMTPADYARLYQPHLLQRFWPNEAPLQLQPCAQEMQQQLAIQLQSELSTLQLQWEAQESSSLALFETFNKTEQHLLGEISQHNQTLESYQLLEQSLERFEMITSRSDSEPMVRLKDHIEKILIEMAEMKSAIDAIETELPQMHIALNVLRESRASLQENNDQYKAHIEKLRVTILSMSSPGQSSMN